MKKVLLVNDCKLESIIMKDCLNNLGYEVNITNEYEALTQIDKFEPFIVIVNLVMKDTTGDKLIRKIKIKNSTIGCILSSCDTINIEKFRSCGIDEIINTPVELNELENAMNKVSVKVNKVEDEEIRFKFCPYCGENLEGKLNSFSFCPYCGKKIK